MYLSVVEEVDFTDLFYFQSNNDISWNHSTQLQKLISRNFCAKIVNEHWTIVYLWKCWFHGKIDYQTNLVTNIGVWISIRSVIIAWYISKYQSKHYSNSNIPLLGSLSVKLANYWGLFLGLFRSFFRKFFARHFSRKIFRTAVFRFREKCEKLCSTSEEK